MPLEMPHLSDYNPPDVAAYPCDPACRAMPAHWHVVQTEPAAEFIALRSISALPRVRAWLPLEVRHRRKMQHRRPVIERGHYVTEEVLRSLFPGYLFAAFDPEEPDWVPIHRARGVKRLFCRPDGMPITLREGVVEALQARGRAGDGALDLDAPAMAPLSPGDRVRLPGGPFADLDAVVQWSDQRRVEVLLGMLRLTVGRDQVVTT